MDYERVRRRTAHAQTKNIKNATGVHGSLEEGLTEHPQPVFSGQTGLPSAPID